MIRPPLNPIVAGLPRTTPFISPETLERHLGREFRARLGANESAFGPAPAVIEAICEAAPTANLYGDAELFALRGAIADHLGIAPISVTVGEGIDGLFALLCRLYLTPGDLVVTSLGSYPTFLYHVVAHGGIVHTVPYSDDANDLSALADAAHRTGARMVFLANPDNPTGSLLSAQDIAAFLAAIPPETLLVLDEAYAEYAPELLPPLTVNQPNLLRFRTFSKAYGLAGLRVGYAFGDSETIGAFDSIRNHFGVSRLGQIAAAEALRAGAWIEAVLAQTRAGIARLSDIARAHELIPLPSATNFVAMDCGADGAFAAAILDRLAKRGVFIRKPMAPGLDRLIRVSVGRTEEIDIFEKELEAVLRSLT